MKKTSYKPIRHAGKILLIILAFPFVLTGVLAWSAVLLGKAAFGKRNRAARVG